MAQHKYIGQAITRVDALDKVTGATVYGYDFVLPGMLFGKAVFSTRAHARIKRIDTARARALAGVVAVVTAVEAPWTHGETIQDKPFFAGDKVRFIGEPIAAVAAVDEDIAEAAAQLITVEYEDLPAYFSPEDACRADSAPIHENFDDYFQADYIVGGSRVNKPNVLEHFKLRTGDVEKAFAAADVVFADRYTVPVVSHAAMEPHAALAQVDPETARITLWTPTDAPFRAREELAQAFDCPEENFRLLNPFQGGGFGSKGGLKVEPIAVALAFHTNGQPVRVKFNREETFRSTLTRHGVVAEVKSGITKDGQILAREITIYWGAGAYAEKSATVCIRGSLFAPGPYRIPNVKIDGYSVYTNTPVAGAYRGYGIPQVAWACEQHMDELAGLIDMDPLEFRLINAYEEGDTSYWGEKLHAVGLKECLTKAAAAVDWHEPRENGTSRGLACMIKPSKIPTWSNSAVLVDGDGEISLLAGTVEIGQGCNTAFSQIVADELRVPMDHVTYADLDTDRTPFDSSTTSSRSTFHMGNAARAAAIDAREKIMELAATLFEANKEDLVLSDGHVHVKGSPWLKKTIGEIIATGLGAGAIVRGEGSFSPEGGIFPDLDTGQTPKGAAFYMYGAHAAEVSVDEDTGDVHVHRIAAAHDVGKAINPVNCEAQIEGGVAMGLGHALHEQLVYNDQGEIMNPSFLDYHLLTSSDYTEIIPIIVEYPVSDGPYGANGIGEPPVTLPPAAVGNAVAGALQCRIRDLPITPERVYWAVQARDTGAPKGS